MARIWVVSECRVEMARNKWLACLYIASMEEDEERRTRRTRNERYVSRSWVLECSEVRCKYLGM